MPKVKKPKEIKFPSFEECNSTNALRQYTLGSKADKTVIRPCQDFYVLDTNADPQNLPKTGNEWCFARVQSIHTVRRRYYVVIHWYLHPGELQKHLADRNKCDPNVERMGPNELAATDWKEVIPVSRLYDLADVKAFDERNPDNAMIGNADFYYRWTVRDANSPSPRIEGINTFCVCSKIYHPLYDHQRLCPRCKKWFDSSCLDSKGPLEIPDDASLLEKLLMVPVYRGSGKFLEETINDHQAWEIVGSQFIKTHLEQLKAEGATELDTIIDKRWDGIMKEDLPTRHWDIYGCPDCHIGI